ncbi:secretin N-terminal domain-containing protein [Undibacterium sp. TS12]|uniref:secretin N-terminal domain-containing protein n=1 Tax=Undibacterium sp. TS12 TaxID=2908202 RepID=UPI001F4CBC1C|nr:secretin N-terminal domain-containing protein [Undibacterium sp. TS12]MCH8621747.1 cohesin domain-containing protein [Undibacterium sp. TS12]
MISFRQKPYYRLLALLAVSLTLFGCAAQMAYREGKDLIAQDKLEDGLEKFRLAMTDDPGQLEYRKAYLKTREQIIYNLSEQADQAMKLDKLPVAKKHFQRILNIDPSNEQARAGLVRLDQLEQHAALLTEAQTAFDKKEYGRTQSLLKKVLAENPGSVAGNKLARMVAELQAQAPQENKLNASYKKSINIEFRDAPVKQVFEVISRTSGINFLFDRDVKTDQRTSLFLKNSTIEAAIHFALLTNQLEKQVLDANTILIYPNTSAKQKEYQEMIVKSFYLSNAEAKNVSNSLKTLVKTRDIVVDEKLNMLILRDSPDAIRLAEKIIALQDLPEPEVMLEVEILEIKRTRLLDLGIQWPNTLGLSPLAGASGSTLKLSDLKTNLNPSTIAATVGPVSVKARRETGDANLLANPRIRAKNHEKAKILIGERVPNITTTATSTGFVSENINYIEVGLKLEVEPTIYLDNDVGIKIALEVSSLTNQLKTQSGSVAYQIGTRTASTVLRLKNGETQILAGLINDEERNSANKVPGVGELPVVGRLFGSQLDDSQKTEIVLSITPHLIRNIQQPEMRNAEFQSGTDSSFRVRPELSDSASPVNTNTSNATVDTTRTAVKNDANPNTGAGVNNNGGPGAMGTGTGGVAMTGMPQMEWQGPRSVKIGDVFSMQLIMQSDQPVTAVPLTLGFDPQVLQVVNVNEGIFLKQGGAVTNFTAQIDPKGQVVVSNTRTGGGASSPGSLMTVNFRAMAAAEASPIKVLSVMPVGAAGRNLQAQALLPFNLEVQP